ncbi:hypothetical protein [Geodermatophilus normandii]|uniref:transmembrane-type terpene cyclase n=1 Tax=Geodermatophilus normandii TaxID=1137989 RepID=UPI001FE58DCB|nr:hypothetical protein [Geodermatophilus normandii]
MSGIAWTVVYVEAIRIGLTQRTYALPVAALALNVAWESIYSVWGLRNEPGLQAWVTVVWALADLVIVWTFLRYGRAEFPSWVTRAVFGWGAAGLFATAFVVQWAFVTEFGFPQAARYTAFLQNLLMSGLFVAVFVARGGPRGQSLTIAVAKWIGTAAPTVVFGVHERSPFVLTLGVLCFVVDVAYIGLLARARVHPEAFDGTGGRAGVPRAG